MDAVRKSSILLSLLVLIQIVDGRKSYIIKEKINSGELRVQSPRVMAFDCEWCFFKDSNNDYCIQGSSDWKVGVEHKIDSQDSTVSGIPPYFRY